MHLYERLLAEYLRKKRGDEAVRSFARKIGLTHGTLHRIENLQQSVTLGRLGSIMDKLNCSWDDIFGKAPIRQKSLGRSKSGAIAVSKGPK
jgi:transcriptional regulator with XRE-family HTH domain